MTRLMSGAVYAAVRYFGSWDEALRAAGIDPVRVRLRTSKWTPERIVSEIRRIGPPFSSRRFSLVNRSLVVSAYRHFPHWRDAVRAAGFKPVSQQRKTRPRARGPFPPSPRRKWTREKIIETIRERAKLGLPLGYDSVRRGIGSNFLPWAEREFGGWSAAKRAAGIRETAR